MDGIDESFKLTYKNSTELTTEYPFFYDGITVYEFDKEFKALAQHYANGGTSRNYIPLWKQNIHS